MIHLEYIMVEPTLHINLKVHHSKSNEIVSVKAEETLWNLTSDSERHTILNGDCCNYGINRVVFLYLTYW